MVWLHWTLVLVQRVYNIDQSNSSMHMYTSYTRLTSNQNCVLDRPRRLQRLLSLPLNSVLQSHPPGVPRVGLPGMLTSVDSVFGAPQDVINPGGDPGVEDPLWLTTTRQESILLFVFTVS